MDDDTKVKMFIEFMCCKTDSESQEIIDRYPNVPDYFFTDDFSKKMWNIAYLRRSIVTTRWFSFFDICYKKMFSSHEMYLTFLMSACITEKRYHQNIFESFICVCILIDILNTITLKMTGLDFCHLNPDILMVFYRNEMKVNFHKRGGFRRFEGYIRGQTYVRRDCVNNNPAAILKPLEIDFDKELEKELSKVAIEKPNLDSVANDKRSINLARLVLSIPSIKLPILPNYSDLMKRIEAEAFAKTQSSNIVEKTSKAKEVGISEDLKVEATVQGGSDSVSDSKTNLNDLKHREDIGQYKDIIQAVIRYNHSKSSSNESTNSPVQKEAEGVLEHLKNTIKSLAQFLDESHNE